MDNFCTMFGRIIDWIDRTQTPPLPWLGQAGGRLSNPPAEQIEIMYAVRGSWDKIHIGEKIYSIPNRHVGMHNIHFGNSADEPADDHLAWCLFLDISTAKGFGDLQKAPFCASVPVTEPDRLHQAFTTLMHRCVSLFGHGWTYPHGKFAYPHDAHQQIAKSSRLFIKTALLELLTCLLQEGERSGTRAEELPQAISRALEFICQHYADGDVFLDTIAADAGLSVDHFGRLFRKHIGMAPMRYLQELRIEKSRFLLSHTDLFVEEIARAVGFRDQFYFSRIFHRQAGFSPTDYRQNERAKA